MSSVNNSRQLWYCLSPLVSFSYRHDELSNRHYIIQEGSGKQKSCDPSGMPLKRFFPAVSG